MQTGSQQVENNVSIYVFVLGPNCKVWDLSPTLEVWATSEVWVMLFSQGSYQLVSEPSTISLSYNQAAPMVTPALQCLLRTSQRG